MGPPFVANEAPASDRKLLRGVREGAGSAGDNWGKRHRVMDRPDGAFLCVSQEAYRRSVMLRAEGQRASPPRAVQRNSGGSIFPAA